MSDDLSPAEQARAARWAADWLTDAGFDVSDTARDAMSSLSFHADKLDPPETVKSLRAERDKALADVAHWREQCEVFRRYWLGARKELDAANDMIARPCATHTEAEAARGRCSRED